MARPAIFAHRFSADEQTATTAGPAKSVGGGIDYSKRLDADQSISFSLGANTLFDADFGAAWPDFLKRRLIIARAASYSRQFGTRLFGGVNLAARKLTQNGPDPKDGP